jgi:hypothetical protein
MRKIKLYRNSKNWYYKTFFNLIKINICDSKNEFLNSLYLEHTVLNNINEDELPNEIEILLFAHKDDMKYYYFDETNITRKNAMYLLEDSNIFIINKKSTVGYVYYDVLNDKKYQYPEKLRDVIGYPKQTFITINTNI